MCIIVLRCEFILRGTIHGHLVFPPFICFVSVRFITNDIRCLLILMLIAWFISLIKCSIHLTYLIILQIELLSICVSFIIPSWIFIHNLTNNWISKVFYCISFTFFTSFYCQYLFIYLAVFFTYLTLQYEFNSFIWANIIVNRQMLVFMFLVNFVTC